MLSHLYFFVFPVLLHFIVFIGLSLILLSVRSVTPFPPLPFDWFAPRPLLAWQGTDLMHNHVLADVDQSCVDAVGWRGSGFPSSDQSEDSDYDSIWITHTNRMGYISRKSSCSDQRHITLFYSLYIDCEELFRSFFLINFVLVWLAIDSSGYCFCFLNTSLS